MSPEAAAGGPIALVRDGDIVTLDPKNRSLTVDVSDAEMEARRGVAAAAVKPGLQGSLGSYAKRRVRHVARLRHRWHRDRDGDKFKGRAAAWRNEFATSG